jgi:CelD/BcsL family acetyltransferase involved in cellulose biosynthesis
LTVRATAPTAPLRTAAPVQLDHDDRSWLAFVSDREDALPFHHPAWLETISRSYGYRPFIIALKRADGDLAAGLPLAEVDTPLRRRRWVSLPFTDYCPPLASREDAVTLVSAVDSARTAAGASRLDFHAEVPGGVPTGTAVRHVLTLNPDADSILAGLGHNHLRNVRKSERSGLVLRHAQSRSDVVDRYYDLHVRTRRRLGVPTQPRRFFAQLWTYVLEPRLGFLLFALDRDRPVAGAVFLTGGKTVVYKYGASEPSSWPLRPNHLIFASALRWACENGFHRFDFGRTDLEDEGLRAFKAGWGAIEEPLVYTSFGRGVRPPAPRPNVRRMGRALIRHAPAAVSRLTGALLYRHAA